MSWIKRNLYFVIGGLVTVALMGMAGFYLYQKVQLDNQARENLNQGYEELKQLYNANPHPGDGVKVDNVKEAQKQQDVLRELLGKVREHFQAIPPIPNKTEVRDNDFAAALRQTIAQLQRDATNASVALSPNYEFSFKAIKPEVQFVSRELPLLASQLGEVKAICEVLYRAKINSLENLRREPVSTKDNPALAAADYLEQKSVTNDLAVLAPYEVNFRCFSAELAAVLDYFRMSPHGFIVKDVRVETAAAFAAGLVAAAALSGSESQPASVVPAVPGVSAVPARSGVPIVINEKLLRVSLLLDVVRLLPPATGQP